MTDSESVSHWASDWVTHCHWVWTERERYEYEYDYEPIPINPLTIPYSGPADILLSFIALHITLNCDILASANSSDVLFPTKLAWSQ